MRQWKCTACGYVHEGGGPPDACPQCGAGKWRFILNEPLSEELEARVKEALAAEAKAHVRNQAFAEIAFREGHPQIGRLFAAVAEAERVHANEYLKYIHGLLGSTEDNLKTAFENEVKAHTEGYAPLIKAAMAGKREDLTWSFIRARDVEDRHAKLYKAALAAMAGDRDVEYHVCQVCGYVFDGALPEQCPVCRADRSQFKPVP
jgi:rubrerythrin